MFKFFKRSTPETAAPVEQPARRRFVPRAMARMFSAAEDSRMNSGWSGTPLTADQIIDRNQRVLVARSREQSANNDYGRSFLRMCRQNIVGHQGVQLQAQSTDDKGKLDTLANQAIEKTWAEWTKKQNCDVTGKMSWRSIQAACVNSAAKDGEFMLRLIFGRDAGPFGFAVQILDPQRCDVGMNDKNLRGGEFIRHGIRFNRFGRPLSYFFSTVDETESTYSHGGKNYVEVPADQIVHGFLSDMVGQKRGLPWMATALFRMRQLAAMEEAAIVNARAGANKLGFIKWKDGFGPEMDDGEELLVDSQPGEWQVLPEGAEVQETNPNYPNGEFEPFSKSAKRSMAAGFGVLYNNLCSDLEGVNFSSIRQGTLDEREHWKDLQEWLIEQLIQPVFESWLPRMLLAARIQVKGRPLRAERIDRYSVITWQARRWQWIDPRADVQSAVDSKNNMLTSAGRIIREQGQDPQTVWAEAARDVRAMIDAYVAEGLDEKTATELVLLSMGKQPEKPAPTGPKNEN